MQGAQRDVEIAEGGTVHPAFEPPGEFTQGVLGRREHRVVAPAVAGTEYVARILVVPEEVFAGVHDLDALEPAGDESVTKIFVWRSRAQATSSLSSILSSAASRPRSPSAHESTLWASTTIGCSLKANATTSPEGLLVPEERSAISKR